MQLLSRPDVLRRLAFSAVIANVLIVITGGAVRLTSSGLGCPTWPTCSEDSYVTNAALGIHGAIENINRMFSVVVGLIALAVVVSAWVQRPRRRRVVLLAALSLAGIPAQAVVGGITVLTDLNPWVVGCHFLVSMGVLAAAYACWQASGEGDGTPTPTVAPRLRQLAWVIVAVAGLVLVVGTVVTGSGPHAGDEKARRTGLDPTTVSQAHADLVFLLLGLVVAAWFALHAVPEVRRRVTVLLVLLLGQGVIGFVQYFTHLPEALVAAHMAGACVVWLGTLSVLFATRVRADAPSAIPASPALTTAAR